MENTFGVPIIPHNDLQRIAALRRYEILDTAPEPSFTNIAELAHSFFNVPITLISLVDTSRVFFKANIGMGNIRYVERGKSFCSLAILHKTPTVFEDALQDPALVTNPLVSGAFGLRFYAGAPLVSSDGFNIGTICIIDKEPRQFDEAQKQHLEKFAALVMHDIELRLASQTQTRDLEKKVAERTLELSTAIEDLQRSNEELEQFAYVASHDLQEPLRRIMNFSRLISDRFGTSIPADASAHLKVIDTAADRMSLMIRDVLNYARVSRESHRIARVDLNEVLVDVCSTLDAQIIEADARVECEELPTVNGNLTQFKQVFANLLSNALKFRVEGVQPLIQIHAELADGHSLPVNLDLVQNKTYCCIKVRDNGIGFNAEHAERIFQLFQRLHSGVQYQGTGIGLALCKKILKHHGGDIVAFSKPGKGAEFQLWLPVVV